MNGGALVTTASVAQGTGRWARAMIPETMTNCWPRRRSPTRPAVRHRFGDHRSGPPTCTLRDARGGDKGPAVHPLAERCCRRGATVAAVSAGHVESDGREREVLELLGFGV